MILIPKVHFWLVFHQVDIKWTIIIISEYIFNPIDRTENKLQGLWNLILKKLKR